MVKIKIWIKDRYRQAVNSIAFYPAIIAISFLLISFLSISFDFSEQGKQFKSQLHLLRLRDASTARSIISSIAAGIISLTVFSFSMVMIVLNQTASQMSNRILDKLIGSRFHQVVLGVYVGTIVYALFLLSSIRDIDSGIRIPALSTYLLILITILDVFLFIYFLHYITQSVKYEVIIRRIFKETKLQLEHKCCLSEEPSASPLIENASVIYSEASGIYENFEKHSLLDICHENDCTLQILPAPGTFILKGLPIVNSDKRLPRDVMSKINDSVNIRVTESVEENFFYGFRQLSEVAIKALSPGINDPGTAIECMRALFKLYAHRLCHFPDNVIKNEKYKTRIIINELSFEDIFETTLLPIWDYGKNDRMIQHEIRHLLTMLFSLNQNTSVEQLLHEVELKILKENKSNKNIL
ncbi:DUF2254 domain-containing protein [Solitalea koreensis]|uniref:Uncharacterized membrane protein n=1 Tax=Solitalea koreensis TaxID=543615 RepID=A0A521DKR5_9SPHI|nr:DUF2254 domain-containing protein [Solitalea koreensis]SMO72286.1 Uncharacterized membrane protein [Solitalea koreensis]